MRASATVLLACALSVLVASPPAAAQDLDAPINPPRFLIHHTGRNVGDTFQPHDYYSLESSYPQGPTMQIAGGDGTEFTDFVETIGSVSSLRAVCNYFIGDPARYNQHARGFGCPPLDPPPQAPAPETSEPPYVPAEPQAPAPEEPNLAAWWNGLSNTYKLAAIAAAVWILIGLLGQLAPKQLAQAGASDVPDPPPPLPEVPVPVEMPLPGVSPGSAATTGKPTLTQRGRFVTEDTSGELRDQRGDDGKPITYRVQRVRDPQGRLVRTDVFYSSKLRKGAIFLGEGVRTQFPSDLTQVTIAPLADGHFLVHLTPWQAPEPYDGNPMHNALVVNGNGKVIPNGLKRSDEFGKLLSEFNFQGDGRINPYADSKAAELPSAE